MSERHLIEQFGLYGHWLETELGVPLTSLNWIEVESPETSPLLDQQVSWAFPGRSTDEVLTSGPRPLKFLLLVAFGLLLAVGFGIVGIARTTWSDDELTAGANDVAGLRALADYAPDPPGTLFVLPDPQSGLALSDVQSWQEDPASEESETITGASYARFDGETYRDALGITTGSGDLQNLATAFRAERWKEVPAPGGVVLVSLDDYFLRTVLQQRDGHWVSLSSTVQSTDELVALLGDVRVGGDGTIEVNESLGLAMMETFVMPPDQAGGISFNLGPASDGSLYTIETGATFSIALAPVFVGGQWKPEVRQGRFAWVVKGGLGDQGTNTVFWQATPNRVMVLSGFVPIEEIW